MGSFLSREKLEDIDAIRFRCPPFAMPDAIGATDNAKSASQTGTKSYPHHHQNHPQKNLLHSAQSPKLCSHHPRTEATTTTAVFCTSATE